MCINNPEWCFSPQGFKTPLRDEFVVLGPHPPHASTGNNDFIACLSLMKGLIRQKLIRKGWIRYG